jgi:ligand-binding sensor domain-containing protein
VFALLEDRYGAIRVGTQTGLDRLNPGERQISTCPAGPGSSGARAGARRGTMDGGLDRIAPRTLSADRVTALAEDRTGRIWVGTDGGGLNVLEPDR